MRVSECVLLWFRRDLRLADNRALAAALRSGKPVVPVFLWAPEEEGAWRPGPASCWWLHQSLEALDAELRRRGSRLIIRAGSGREALSALAGSMRVQEIFANESVEPVLRMQDEHLAALLAAGGVRLHLHPAALLHEPKAFLSSQGKPYQVFTPFWRSLQHRLEIVPELPAPPGMPAPAQWPDTLPLAALALEPRVDWASGIRAAWTPGEAGAWARVHRFVEEGLPDYPEGRDRPDRSDTSRLSPHLHFGEISPHAVWRTVQAQTALHPEDGRIQAAESFLRQLAWREFAHHVLAHFPHTPEQPLRGAFAAFAWQQEAGMLRAWQRGRTGYPIVDAGMRELWSTGWMHNRVRMIAASFLTKDLLRPWQEGAAWFWHTLVDADLANNTFGWQWVAGCGADAAPYFRIFNPVLQGEKFDPEGEYVRRWIPELARLPAKWIHRPWESPDAARNAAGVRLGESYPLPVVNHAEARSGALAAYAAIRDRSV